MRHLSQLSSRRLAMVSAAILVAVLAGSLPTRPAVASSGASPAGGAVWAWPVASPHPVVRPFVGPPNPWSPGHRGIDVGTVPGSVVTAPDDGVVHFAGVVVDRPVLSIRHADGVLSSVEPVVAEVARGDAVTRGQTVGVLDEGHCADRPCLHLGARVDGEYVSPLLFLGEIEPSVLLPTRPR
ncbi:murein hydrolase activator EnvC [Frigoribacterium sp. VKM Ac-2836]|uniref:murein hydrolase activator EnvC family protein n=1 Tax=Frigoribacterium sp. VKM Ac-2836 TaxID=2739014 RepID=UPI001567480C|nr:peptidoglycan DD-metalloendopeptidase family protein [Frigoribacterium sp. VKM Ac-2836]NRD25562.1 M23 family metallopeptidase [Frigoribacterium sp. VKM Ac-2836]